MAIDISSSALLSALRLGSTSEETSEAQRLLSFATQTISDYLGDEYEGAPPAILNEAAIRLCGFIFDMPYAARGAAFANALRNSGAGAMLLPYRIHRAGSVSEATAAAQAAVGSTGNPVVDVQVSGSSMTIIFADGTTRTEALPSGGGMGGVDEDARSAAAAAQTRADSAHTLAETKTDENEVAALIESHRADPDAHHTPPEVGGGETHAVVSDGIYDGHLQGPPVVMRLGWNQSRNMNAAVFTRANDHPIDGVAVGMSNGIEAPPFPPAINSDPSLFLGIWIAGDPEVAALPSSFDASEKYVLSVAGVAGHYFASTQRLPESTEGAIIRAVIVGPRILTTEDGGGGVVVRERLIFPASSYVYQSQGDTGVSGGITTLSIAYPTGTDQDFWKGKLKTAFVAEDPDVASLVIGPMVEARSTAGDGMYTSDEKIRLGFDATLISLTIFGISLAVNQRNSWFVWLVGV